MSRTLDDFVREALTEVIEIPAAEASQLLREDSGWHFLDVREPDEFAEARIPGARNSPRGFLEVRADLEHEKRDPWLSDRSRKLLLYCGGGNRSALAARTLQQMGFVEVLSLAGGFKAWLEAGLPTDT
ncbi:hypothetical protein MK489_02910 [Myxococcota bacterium]|nr:hypothetical protein [Myxococcota bacterium]